MPRPVDFQAVSKVTETDRLIEALQPVIDRAARERERRRTVEYRESLEILKAVRLAPSLGLCEALLRGERAPGSWLDKDWLKAYGAKGHRARS